jgi:ABC-type phosphate transport system substrate-binding protein
MYTPGAPQGDEGYLDWILGPEGQKIVGELGFVPLK